MGRAKRNPPALPRIRLSTPWPPVLGGKQEKSGDTPDPGSVPLHHSPSFPWKRESTKLLRAAALQTSVSIPPPSRSLPPGEEVIQKGIQGVQAPSFGQTPIRAYSIVKSSPQTELGIDGLGFEYANLLPFRKTLALYAQTGNHDEHLVLDATIVSLVIKLKHPVQFYR